MPATRLTIQPRTIRRPPLLCWVCMQDKKTTTTWMLLVRCSLVFTWHMLTNDPDRNLLNPSDGTFEPSCFGFTAPSAGPFVRSTPRHLPDDLHTQPRLGRPYVVPSLGFTPGTLPSSNLDPSPTTRNIIQSQQTAHRLQALQQGTKRQELTPPMHSSMLPEI